MQNKNAIRTAIRMTFTKGGDFMDKDTIQALCAILTLVFMVMFCVLDLVIR
jgi:hypothetical protein